MPARASVLCLECGLLSDRRINTESELWGNRVLCRCGVWSGVVVAFEGEDAATLRRSDAFRIGDDEDNHLLPEPVPYRTALGLLALRRSYFARSVPPIIPSSQAPSLPPIIRPRPHPIRSSRPTRREEIPVLPAVQVLPPPIFSPYSPRPPTRHGRSILTTPPSFEEIESAEQFKKRVRYERRLHRARFEHERNEIIRQMRTEERVLCPRKEPPVCNMCLDNAPNWSCVEYGIKESVLEVPIVLLKVCSDCAPILRTHMLSTGNSKYRDWGSL